MPNANRLARETSPYLLQHAHNPVDWFPWGEEAFAAARKEDKPLLLSVGYAACHWCHVMERESFENAGIADLMNRNFVCVKVDREERPDVDEVYMTAVQMLTGSGGWPMTVFLTPDGQPFWGGTYFPPADRGGMPGFPRVLTAISRAWNEDRDAAIENAKKLSESIRQTTAPSGEASEIPDAGAVARGADTALRVYDERNGGFGSAPKFPNPFVLRLMLHAAKDPGDERFRNALHHSLRQMAAGGIRDHVGEGFHRYSVDATWLVPHFEKMLYDNALLAELYYEASLVLDDPELRDVGRGVLAYLDREMRAPEGAFWSTQDADSEGEEGIFFLWTPAQIREVVGGDAALFEDAYGVTEDGNFEGRNILNRRMNDRELAERHGLDVEAVRRKLRDARAALFEARSKRIAPDRDEKVLLGWNAMAITAFAKAARIDGSAAYRDAAEQAVAFLDAELADGDSWAHSWKDGRKGVPAFLDDLALYGLARLDLLQTTFDTRHLEAAERIGERVLSDFADGEGGFYMNADDAGDLFTRPRSQFDGATPSGTGAALALFDRLRAWTDDDRWEEGARGILAKSAKAAEANPYGHALILTGLDVYRNGPASIALTAPDGAKDVEPLLDLVNRRWLPHHVWFSQPHAAGDARLPDFAKFLPDKVERPTAIVCRGQTCSRPLHTADELADALDANA